MVALYFLLGWEAQLRTSLSTQYKDCTFSIKQDRGLVVRRWRSGAGENSQEVKAFNAQSEEEETARRSEQGGASEEERARRRERGGESEEVSPAYLRLRRR